MQEGLEWAITEIQKIRDEFWKDVRIPVRCKRV
jgi:hypothetical protein